MGRGRFRVGEGRWESLQGRLLTRGTGALASSSDEVLTVSLGGAVPEDLQKDPPEPEQKIRIPDDHDDEH